MDQGTITSLISAEQAKEYMCKNGYDDDYDVSWLLALPRQNQVQEAIDKNIHPVDFERWQHLQNLLFGNNHEELSWKTASNIINLLWEEDIEVLELPFAERAF